MPTTSNRLPPPPFEPLDALEEEQEEEGEEEEGEEEEEDRAAVWASRFAGVGNTASQTRKRAW